MMQTPLFQSPNLHLTAIDVDKDAPVEANWTLDMSYARYIGDSPVKPRTIFEMKRYYQNLNKRINEKGNVFHFAVRLCRDDRLVGFMRVDDVQWSNGVGFLELALGDRDVRGHFEPELLALALRYAFRELNLFRVEVHVPDNDEPAKKLYEMNGFALETRRRAVYYMNGRLWDMLYFGMLLPEWEAARQEVPA